jgi:hypothetical protein
MSKKDKFAQMHQNVNHNQNMEARSFQDLVDKAVETVAYIDRKQDSSSSSVGEGSATTSPSSPAQQPTATKERYTHLANPWISMREYNLASNYCNSFDNMTRMDWMELAIIEKLHNDGLMPDDEFNARHTEITSRPPRGLRKNTKVQKNR